MKSRAAKRSGLKGTEAALCQREAILAAIAQSAQKLLESPDWRMEIDSMLALAKRIVEFHGGRIWVENNPHQRGAMFCFTLPAEKI